MQVLIILSVSRLIFLQHLLHPVHHYYGNLHFSLQAYMLYKMHRIVWFWAVFWMFFGLHISKQKSLQSFMGSTGGTCPFLVVTALSAPKDYWHHCGLDFPHFILNFLFSSWCSFMLALWYCCVTQISVQPIFKQPWCKMCERHVNDAMSTRMSPALTRSVSNVELGHSGE